MANKKSKNQKSKTMLDTANPKMTMQEIITFMPKEPFIRRSGESKIMKGIVKNAKFAIHKK
jgi:hypothetical protein